MRMWRKIYTEDAYTDVETSVVEEKLSIRLLDYQKGRFIEATLTKESVKALLLDALEAYKNGIEAEVKGIMEEIASIEKAKEDAEKTPWLEREEKEERIRELETERLQLVSEVRRLERKKEIVEELIRILEEELEDTE